MATKEKTPVVNPQERRKVFDALIKAPVYIKEIKMTPDIVDRARKGLKDDFIAEILQRSLNSGYTLWESLCFAEEAFVHSPKKIKTKYEDFVKFAALIMNIPYSVERRYNV